MLKALLLILLTFNFGFCQNFKDEKLLVDLSSVVSRLQQEMKIIYASPNGSGDGSINNPYSLAVGLTNVKPGQRLVLLTGHYSITNFSALVSGTPIAPIIITGYGKVDIDCQNYFSIKGSDITIDGLEFYTISWTGDRFTTAQRFDFSIEGARTTLKNCIVHDFGNNGLWSNAPDSHIEGCLFYNTGRGGTSQGHSLYTQNAEGTMTIKNNIFLAGNYNSSFCLHLYGSGGARGLRGYRIERNVFFGGRNLIGSGGQKVFEIYFNNNVLIKGNIELGAGGWAAEPLHEFNLDGNRLWDAGYNIKKAGILNLTHTRATVGSMQGNVTNVVAGNIDYNHYVYYGTDRGINYNRVNYNYVYGCCADALQPVRDKLGWEIHSTEELRFGGVPPDEIDVNLYQTDRANVAIANYSLANNVNVSFPGMDIGTYRAYNAQNPKEWFDFEFVGAAVSFPMTGWTVSPPIGTAGGSMVQTSTMFPKFGIFYITKKP